MHNDWYTIIITLALFHSETSENARGNTTALATASIMLCGKIVVQPTLHIKHSMSSKYYHCNGREVVLFFVLQ